MDQRRISHAMKEGAPITCATCRFYHEGNGQCGKTECGGPTSGRDFPSYDGLLPREKFVERCLVCGVSEITFHIIVSDSTTKFSLCTKHRGVFDYVGAPEGKIKHLVKLIAIP